MLENRKEIAVQHPHFETYRQRDSRRAWEETKDYLAKCEEQRKALETRRVLEASE